MFRQNVFHTGYTNFTGPLAPDIAWQYNTTGFTYSSPVITSTRVYIASENELVALDLDGEELWSFTFNNLDAPPAVEISGIVSTPAVGTNGTVYIGSLDNNLYALNPNGTLQWSLDTGDQVFSSPTISPDGTIFIGSRSGNVFAVNPDGSVRWVAATQGEILSSVAVGPDGSVYVGATDNRLYGLNGANGATLWPPFTTQGEIVSSPAIGNGNVYVGSLDNNVYAVDTETGRAAWAAPFPTAAEIVSSPAIGQDGTVYIGSFDRRFYAINGQTGTAKWQSPFITQSLIAASPAIDGFGNIYITSLDGSLYVLSDATSRFNLLWSFPTGNPIWSSPSIGTNSRVYIAATGSLSEPGRLFAIGQANYSITFATQLLAGQDAPFSVSVTGAPIPASGSLFYRPAGAAGFSELGFNGNAIIPGTAITGAGFEYYISGNEGTFPAESPQNNPASKPVFINSDSAPDHFLPRIHRMISVPYDLTNKSILDVLEDDFQAYGPQTWRLHRWNGNGYEEYPDLNDPVEPGAAFFLVTSSGDPFTVSSGWSIDTSQPYAIDLKPGWNQIGNPFGFPVPWNRVIRNTAAVNAIAFFDGSQMVQQPDDLTILMPWEGYFVHNASDEVITILIRPEAVQIETELPVDEAEKGSPAAMRMQLTAAIPSFGYTDSQNWIGFDAAPAESSMLEAPPFGEHVRLSLLDNNEKYAIHFQPHAEAGARWPLMLTTSDADVVQNNLPVTLSIVPQQGAGNAPEMVLIDEDYGYARTFSNNEVSVDWGDNLTERRFTLVTGTADYLASVLSDVPVAPTTSRLDQNYPNPFNHTTSIGYQLDQRAAVSLTVYNLLGQEVHHLVEEVKNPGQHMVHWDGTDLSGQRVPSGMYMYRIQAGAFSATGKMALVR
ncbi:MAG: PQQ-binding-like beta-propeller repeat protein [Bacteroidota bacterium]